MADTVAVTLAHHGSQKTASVLITYSDGAGKTETIVAAGQMIFLHSLYLIAGTGAASTLMIASLEGTDGEVVIPSGRHLFSSLGITTASRLQREWPGPGKRLNGLVLDITAFSPASSTGTVEIHYTHIFEGDPAP